MEPRFVIKKLINVTFQVDIYQKGKVNLDETTGYYKILHERTLALNLGAYTSRYILDYELRRTADNKETSRSSAAE